MKKGFTLIELIIVIAIIGILSTVGILNLTSLRDRAKKAAFKASVGEYLPKFLSDCEVGNITATDTTVIDFGAITQSCGTSGTGIFSMPVTALSVTGCAGTLSNTGTTFTGCD